MATKLTKEEIEAMEKYFEEIGAKPKVGTLKDFQNWMKDITIAGEEETIGAGTPEPPPRSHHYSASVHHFPKLSLFSGNDDKKDVPFTIWKHEIECIINEGHSKQTVAQAIRSSLRGEALRVHTRLGPAPTAVQVIEKFESLYGIVDAPETTKAKFYSATQREDEDVTSWSSRLEDLYAQTPEYKSATANQINADLCNIFYRGLRSSLRDITGHIYDKVKDFDKLRVAIRQVENDKKERKIQDKEHTKKNTSKVSYR